MEQRICARKRAFGGPHAARLASKVMGKRVKVYRCPECGRWHVSASTTTSTRRDPLDHGLALWRRGRRRPAPTIEDDEED